MIEDGRNPGDEARRRSQDEDDADEEEKGKGGYLYDLGDWHRQIYMASTELKGTFGPNFRALLNSLHRALSVEKIIY